VLAVHLGSSEGLCTEKLLTDDYSAYGHLAYTPIGFVPRPMSEAVPDLASTSGIRASVPYLLALPEVVRSTDLVATVPRRLLCAPIDFHDVVTLEAPRELPAVVDSLWWHPRFDSDPAHQWLRERNGLKSLQCLTMARAKEFDREVVLERAMRFFWEQGYTFGDKHSLFLASLAYYYEIGIGSVVAQLSAPDGGLAAIEEYFDGMARRMTTKPYRSCLLINSAIELAPHDPEVAAIVNRFVNELRKGFANALKVAVAKGDAIVDDIDATAWHLTNSAMGLGPMSKARVPYKHLKLVSERILNSIRA